jgi:hypothetical protein
MNKLILIFFSVILLTSCVTQEKTIKLCNGTYITQKKYDKIIKYIEKDSKRFARKSVRGEMTHKQIRQFEKSL